MKYLLSTIALATLAVARPVYDVASEAEISQELHKRQLGGLLSGGGGCKDVSLIFGRGTWEPGLTDLGILVGTPFYNEVSSTLGSSRVSGEGVPYDAGVFGYLVGGDSAGAKAMAQMVSQKAQQCPNTKIVMGGYSQGAQVAHLAAAQLSADVQNRVVAIVVFGDPYKGDAIRGMSSSKIHTECATSDPICYGIPIPLGSHLGYGFDSAALTRAANFIAEKAGISGGGGGLLSGLTGLSGFGVGQTTTGTSSSSGIGAAGSAGSVGSTNSAGSVGSTDLAASVGSTTSTNAQGPV